MTFGIIRQLTVAYKVYIIKYYALYSTILALDYFINIRIQVSYY